MADEFGKSDLGLNDSEEFVIVKKSDPTHVLRVVNENWHRTVDIGKSPDDASWQFKNYKLHAGYYPAQKGDLVEGSPATLTWNTSSGKRRKINKVKSLYYFLNGLSGRCSADYMFHLGQLDKNTQFNVFNLERAGNSHGPFLDWTLVEQFELRKYDKATKKIHDVAVDFDCYAFGRNFEQMFLLGMAHGPAVADLAKQLMPEGKLVDGFIVHARFDVYKYGADKSWDFGEVPKDKDLYLGKALKDIGLSGAPVSIGANGFAAAWVQTREQADAFVAAYKDKQKTVSVLDVSALLADSRFELSLLTAKQAGAAIKAGPKM